MFISVLRVLFQDIRGIWNVFYNTPYIKKQKVGETMYVEKDQIPYMHENEGKIKNKILEILSYEGFTLVTVQHLFDRIIEEIKENNKINL